MKLGELGVVIETRRCRRSLLQEHHPHREIGNHCSSDRSFGRKFGEIVQLRGAETCGANHGMHAVGDSRSGVIKHHGRMGEVHQHSVLVGIPYRLAYGTKATFEISCDGDFEFTDPKL